jgi:hypothetical protein
LCQQLLHRWASTRSTSTPARSRSAKPAPTTVTKSAVTVKLVPFPDGRMRHARRPNYTPWETRFACSGARAWPPSTPASSGRDCGKRATRYDRKEKLRNSPRTNPSKVLEAGFFKSLVGLPPRSDGESRWPNPIPRFEHRYAFWRGPVDGVVARYLECGILDHGFARIRCPECKKELLLAFCCKGRGLCPSCGAKRAAAFAAFLPDELLADVGHAQWVFTVPKLLRPYFMHHRELLGPLCWAAWETVRDLMAEAVCEKQGFGPGMVAVVQTFGDQLNLHPHVHALVTRGGWTASGEWIGVPYGD